MNTEKQQNFCYYKSCSLGNSGSCNRDLKIAEICIQMSTRMKRIKVFEWSNQSPGSNVRRELCKSSLICSNDVKKEQKYETLAVIQKTLQRTADEEVAFFSCCLCRKQVFSGAMFNQQLGQLCIKPWNRIKKNKTMYWSSSKVPGKESTEKWVF